eukprot:653680-Hanusia_phi.AAC.4
MVPVLGEAEEAEVVAVVMAASTRMVYNETHAALMRAMTRAVRRQILALLLRWEKDTQHVFKQSFVRSPDCQ